MKIRIIFILKKTPTRFPDFRYENFYRIYYFKYDIQLVVV